MSDAVCPIGNITPAGRMRRLVLGSAVIFGTFVALVFLLRDDAPFWWRLGALPAFWFGALCEIQALSNT